MTVLLVAVILALFIYCAIRYAKETIKEEKDAKFNSQKRKIDKLGEWVEYFQYEDKQNRKMTMCAVNTEERILCVCEDGCNATVVNGNDMLDVSVIENDSVVVTSQYSLLYGVAMVNGGTIKSSLYIRIITSNPMKPVVTIRLLYGRVNEYYRREEANAFIDAVSGYCLQWVYANREANSKNEGI